MMARLGSPPPNPIAAAIEHRLSPERLGPYRTACDGDLQAAVQLYEWNVRISAAMGETLGQVEVILRNALHEQLTLWHARRGWPGHWYDDPSGILAPRRHDDIFDARQRVARAGRTETPGRVVAELMFGFWRFLLDKQYQPTLWAQALRHAFPNLAPQRRSEVGQRVEAAWRLRNRIAHHEPIHTQPLAQLHDDVMLRLVAYIDRDVAGWLEHLSRAKAVLTTRP